MNFSKFDIEQLNDMERFLSFTKTWPYTVFMSMVNKFIFLCSGNQYGKSGGTAKQYVDRIFGIHPVPKKNMMYFECSKRDKDNLAPHGYYKQTIRGKDGSSITVRGYEKGTWTWENIPEDKKCPFCGSDIVEHDRDVRVFRFCSQTLPGEKDSVEGMSADVRNVVYPEFKKWLPKFLIEKDITFRNYAMIIKDPWAGATFIDDTPRKRKDIIVEFTSYSQVVQSTAGTQRVSIWVDEECPKDFWDEQLPRLMGEDGDIIMSLTPANRQSWSFDELYERADVYYKTQKVCEALSTEDEPLQMTQLIGETTDIGVLQASSYDNPTIGNDVIAQILENVDDEDVKMTRLYGVHKQASGRVFKSFSAKDHVIDGEKYFPHGFYTTYRFARMIDYHERNPWAITWIALSPYNEAFVFQEFSPSPEKMMTHEIAHKLADRSAHYRYDLNLIDPLAEKVQSNTRTTVRGDINRLFREFSREEVYPGFKGGTFQTWDTKSTKGREAVRNRIKWAREVGVPFNNKITVEGVTRYVPTLWIFKECKEMAKSLRQWRYQEYGDRSAVVNKDANEQVTQKFSHFPMCLEAIFKERRFKPKAQTGVSLPEPPKYFQGRKVA